jgi:hypothetical protein
VRAESVFPLRALDREARVARISELYDHVADWIEDLCGRAHAPIISHLRLGPMTEFARDNEADTPSDCRERPD